MKYVVLFLGLVFGPVLSAQTIEGRIVDSQTGEGVSSVHVYATASRIGSISNKEGYFSLKLPKSRSESTITFSHIAYASQVVAVGKGGMLTVELVPDFTSLGQVVVKSTAGELAREVFQKLEASAEEQQHGRGFYRQISMKDTLPTEWIESFINLSYSPWGLREMDIEQARIAESRSRSKDDIHLSSSNFTYLSFMPVYLPKRSPLATPFSPHYFDDYNFYIEEEYKKGADTVVKLAFNPTDKVEAPVETYGWLLYNLSRKKLLQMAVLMDSDLGIGAGFESQGLAIEMYGAQHTVNYEFSTADRNMVELVSVGFTAELKYGEKVSPVSAHSTLLVYDADTKKHKKLLKPKSETNFFEKFKEARYRPRFWQDNPVIRRTAEEDRIIRTLEEAGAFGSYFKGKK